MFRFPNPIRLFLVCAALLCIMAVPDARADLRFTQSAVEVSEADGQVRLTVERTGDLSQSFKAYCDLSARRWEGESPRAPFVDNGVEVTAVLGDDVYPFYRGISIEFPSSDVDSEGAARQMLVIPISNATRIETSDRIFLVRLVTESGASCLGLNPPASVTIHDDDQPRPYEFSDATHIAILRYGGAKNGWAMGWLRVRTTRSGSLTGTICFGIASKVKQFKGQWARGGSFSVRFDDLLGPLVVGGTDSYRLILAARGDSFEAVAMNMNGEGYHGGSWFAAATAKKLVPPTASELRIYQGQFAFSLGEPDHPQGKGRMVVNSRGNVWMSGYLNDGRKFAVASRLFAGGEIPIPNSFFLNTQSRMWGRFAFMGENFGVGELDYITSLRYGRGASQTVLHSPSRSLFEAHRVK